MAYLNKCGLDRNVLQIKNQSGRKQPLNFQSKTVTLVYPLYSLPHQFPRKEEKGMKMHI
jgi:hypothetical protein